MDWAQNRARTGVRGSAPRALTHCLDHAKAARSSSRPESPPPSTSVSGPVAMAPQRPHQETRSGTNVGEGTRQTSTSSHPLGIERGHQGTSPRSPFSFEAVFSHAVPRPAQALVSPSASHCSARAARLNPPTEATAHALVLFGRLQPRHDNSHPTAPAAPLELWSARHRPGSSLPPGEPIRASHLQCRARPPPPPSAAGSSAQTRSQDASAHAHDRTVRCPCTQAR